MSRWWDVTMGRDAREEGEEGMAPHRGRSRGLMARTATLEHDVYAQMVGMHEASCYWLAAARARLCALGLIHHASSSRLTALRAVAWCNIERSRGVVLQTYCKRARAEWTRWRRLY